ncbi:MAG: tetratricopeptide repeat protein [Pseudomonadota bacterium]
MRRTACLGLAFVALLGWSQVTHALDVDKSFASVSRLENAAYAYQKGAYDIAFNEIKPLAEQGNPEAQTYLGYMYAHGEGTLRDMKEAALWYRSAAEQGNMNAQNNLALMYYQGEGVEQSYTDAARWYKKAADQGNANAQNSLGVLYETGQGLLQDDISALRWYYKAAKKRHTEAQLHMGSMYFHGKGVDQNYVQAYKWFLLANSSNRQEPSQIAIEIATAREMTLQFLSAQEYKDAKRLARKWATRYPRPPRPAPKGQWKDLGSALPF